MADLATLQDERTIQEYETDVNAGLYNQKIAVNQAAEDMRQSGWDVYVEWTDKNDEFQSDPDKIAPYNPDATLYFFKDDLEVYGYNREVKVAFYETPFFYLKSYQLGKLLELDPENAYIYLSTPTEYAVVSVKWILDNSDEITKWGKSCRQVWSKNVKKWINYTQKLTLKPSHSKMS